MIVLAALLFGVVAFALAGAWGLSVLFAVLAMGQLLVSPSPDQVDARRRNAR